LFAYRQHTLIRWLARKNISFLFQRGAATIAEKKQRSRNSMALGSSSIVLNMP